MNKAIKYIRKASPPHMVGDGFKKGLEVASKISETPAGGKVTAGQVLNTFREIFGKVNNIK